MDATSMEKDGNGPRIEVLEKAPTAVRGYFRSLVLMLKRPGDFFNGLSEKDGYGRAAAFLLFSSIFFACASLMAIRDRHLQIVAIFWVNAVGMPMISAFFCFMITTLARRRRVSFSMMFAIFAYAAGTVMLVSWVPFFVWATEPWKWYLVCLGMVNALGMKWRQALLAAGLTVASLYLFFYSIFPVVAAVKGWFYGI